MLRNGATLQRCTVRSRDDALHRREGFRNTIVSRKYKDVKKIKREVIKVRLGKLQKNKEMRNLNDTFCVGRFKGIGIAGLAMRWRV